MIVTLEKNKQTAQTTVVTPKIAVSILSPPILPIEQPVVYYVLIINPQLRIVNIESAIPFSFYKTYNSF